MLMLHLLILFRFHCNIKCDVIFKSTFLRYVLNIIDQERYINILYFTYIKLNIAYAYFSNVFL